MSDHSNTTIVIQANGTTMYNNNDPIQNRYHINSIKLISMTWKTSSQVNKSFVTDETAIPFWVYVGVRTGTPEVTLT